MKKRKRMTVHRHRDDEAEPYIEEEEDPVMATEDAKQPVPGLMKDIALPARDPGSSGSATIRGVIDKTFPKGEDVVIARLPPGVGIIGGGMWVTEAFDGGGTLEIGVGADGDIPADPNTFFSVDLAT